MTPLERWQWAYSVPGLDSQERAVLVCIAFHARDESQEAWPSVDLMARETSLSRRSVIRARDRLSERGVILLDRSRGRHSNTYRLVTQPCQADTVQPCHADTVQNSNRAHGTPQPCQADTSTVSTGHPNQVLTDHEPGNIRRCVKKGYSATFLEAISLYPKRIGGNSTADAWKAWGARLREGVTEEQMIEGVKRYAAYCRGDGIERTKYVMQAKTFFGPGEKWDEPWELQEQRKEERVVYATSPH